MVVLRMRCLDRSVYPIPGKTGSWPLISVPIASFVLVGAVVAEDVRGPKQLSNSFWLVGKWISEEFGKLRLAMRDIGCQAWRVAGFEGVARFGRSLRLREGRRFGAAAG